MIWKANNIWFGIACGLVFPVLAFVSTEAYREKLQVLGKEELIYIISIALNLLLLRFYFKEEKENTAGGIMLSTFLSALITFFFKFSQ